MTSGNSASGWQKDAMVLANAGLGAQEGLEDDTLFSGVLGIADAHSISSPILDDLFKHRARKFHIQCFGPEASAVINGRYILVSRTVDSSIFAFSAASSNLWRAMLSLRTSMPVSILNWFAMYSTRGLSMSMPPSLSGAAWGNHIESAFLGDRVMVIGFHGRTSVKANLVVRNRTEPLHRAC